MKHFLIRLCCLTIVGSLFLSGCQIMDPIAQTIEAIQDSRKTIQSESEAWRSQLPQLADRLDQILKNSGGDLSAEAKGIIASSINQTEELFNDTSKIAQLRGEEFMAKFGAEARCNTDFFRSRVTDTLKQLETSLVFWKKNNRLPEPPPTSVCQITPDTLDLQVRGTGGTWSVRMPPDKIVGIYGYNFRPEALPRVELRDGQGNWVRDAQLTVAYVTRYQLNLDFSTENFQQVADGARFVLHWPGQAEINTISTSLARPAILKILSVTFNTSTPRARRDLVSPTVVVSNQGGSDSNAFVITWKPGPDEPLQSLSITSLGPDQQKQIIFPGYTYPTDGAFVTNVTLGEGSDSYQTSLMVTPLASVPYVLTPALPIAGQWPGAGGEPGEEKVFSFNTQALGPDCVLDTSRGSGSFEVDDINRPEVKYVIAWPAGYDFFFTEGTIWRSLSSVSAHMDPQTRTVTAAVTLKGLGGHGGIFGPQRGPERFNGEFVVYYKCPD